MIDIQYVKVYQGIAEGLVDLIPGGVIFLVIEKDTIVWKAASKVFDLKVFNVGEKLNRGSALLQAMEEKRDITFNIPRNVYGIRITVTSSPIVDNMGNVTGVIAVIFPKLHPVAAAFNSFAPFIAEMFPEGAFLYMTDLHKIAYRQSSSRFDIPSIQVGYELQEEDNASKVVQTKKPSITEFDASKHGIPTIFMTYPIFDEENNNEIVATLGMVLPKSNSVHLREMSHTLDYQLSGISSAIEQLAFSASQIHTSEQDLSYTISEIYDFSDKIDEISTFIKQVADKTNLLGLNASIEAARAGEYGKGFSVVAQEIRKLSEQSKGSVPQIKTLIDAIRQKVDEAGEKSKISLSFSQEQAAASQEINASAEELKSLSEELNRIAKNI